MLELNKCYNMDCMDGMAQFPDGFFDLAVVDPPYGLPKDSSNFEKQEERFEQYASQCSLFR